jgi:hypothetical protein
MTSNPFIRNLEKGGLGVPVLLAHYGKITGAILVGVEEHVTHTLVIMYS